MYSTMLMFLPLNTLSEKLIETARTITLDQRWATLFGSQATLVTRLVYAGQYKYNKDVLHLTFERNWVFRCLFFTQQHFKWHFKCLINLKKCSRAPLRCLAGRMWPAGRTLPRPALDPQGLPCPALSISPVLFHVFFFDQSQSYKTNFV